PDAEPGRAPGRGERHLLDRSQQLEVAGNKDAALATAEFLVKLAPRSTAAHDRLAQLQYRAGNRARAAELLAAWHELEPGNHLPLVRRAVVEQQLGNAEARSQAIGQAL